MVRIQNTKDANHPTAPIRLIQQKQNGKASKEKNKGLQENQLHKSASKVTATIQGKPSNKSYKSHESTQAQSNDKPHHHPNPTTSRKNSREHSLKTTKVPTRATCRLHLTTMKTKPESGKPTKVLSRTTRLREGGMLTQNCINRRYTASTGAVIHQEVHQHDIRALRTNPT